ncbi:MAG: hypothetical protein VR69_06105 [Peptococcaceae bacterium BRH_c4b]|nr:MAG: hypothetical protein VR69_06105 [Peptococcaceae bacterium BRH_c4b]
MSLKFKEVKPQATKHPETYLSLNNLGKHAEYQPTFDYKRQFINDNHAYYSICPVKSDVLIDMGIDGWLRRQDALKLYEMSFFARGDILELGCYKGLSTSILSQANYDSGFKKNILSIDLNNTAVEATKQTLSNQGLQERVSVIRDDAVNYVCQLAQEGKNFDFIFIDHSHAYEPVFEVCKELQHIVAPGGFCLFHDYNDIRNINPDEKDYGVFQAVNDGLDKNFEFYGIYGCTALFRVGV